MLSVYNKVLLIKLLSYCFFPLSSTQNHAVPKGVITQRTVGEFLFNGTPADIHYNPQVDIKPSEKVCCLHTWSCKNVSWHHI